MSMLHVITWKWGHKYGQEYVDRLMAGVRRNLRQPYTWTVHEPQREDMYLTEHKGCFARLRMFDPEWQRRHNIGKGDRIACLDLDAVVTGPLDPLFDRTERFVILQNVNALNPCPFNGSLMMLRAGACAEVWEAFSLEKALKIKCHEFPDDQGWIWNMVPNAAGWRAGYHHGVYGFQKRGWPAGDELPVGARYVAFFGWRDPAMFTHVPWIQEHWIRPAALGSRVTSNMEIRS